MAKTNQPPAPAPQTQNLPETPKWRKALEDSRGRFLALTNEKRTMQELGFAAQLIQASPDLQNCSLESIINAVINVARTGITLNPILRLAYLVPRKGKCTLDFDYKGLVKILKDNGSVRYYDVFIVYNDEEFEQNPSDISRIHHKIHYPKTEEEQKSREMIGVYGRALLPTGETVFTQLTPMWQIHKRKDVAKTQNIWRDWYEEMVLKTKAKYDFKLLIAGENSDELVAAMTLDEENNPVNLKPKGKMAQTFYSESHTEDAEAEEMPNFQFQCIKDLELPKGIIKDGVTSTYSEGNFCIQSTGGMIFFAEDELQAMEGDYFRRIPA